MLKTAATLAIVAVNTEEDELLKFGLISLVDSVASSSSAQQYVPDSVGNMTLSAGLSNFGQMK